MLWKFPFTLTCAGLILFLNSNGYAASYTVTSNGDGAVAGTLRNAILLANENSGSTITINLSSGNTITLAAPLPPILTSTTITDATTGGTSIDGVGLYPAFLVDAGGSGTVTISGANSTTPLNLLNLKSTGGAGGAGGGGGALGAGAGTFVSSGTVTISHVNYNNNQAVGGAGGAGNSLQGGGGGGGFAGASGGAALGSGGGGGGGFAGAGGAGGNGTNNLGGGGGGGLFGVGGAGGLGGGGGGSSYAFAATSGPFNGGSVGVGAGGGAGGGGTTGAGASSTTAAGTSGGTPSTLNGGASGVTGTAGGAGTTSGSDGGGGGGGGEGTAGNGGAGGAGAGVGSNPGGGGGGGGYSLTVGVGGTGGAGYTVGGGGGGGGAAAGASESGGGGGAGGGSTAAASYAGGGGGGAGGSGGFNSLGGTGGKFGGGGGAGGSSAAATMAPFGGGGAGGFGGGGGGGGITGIGGAGGYGGGGGAGTTAGGGAGGFFGGGSGSTSNTGGGGGGAALGGAVFIASGAKFSVNSITLGSNGTAGGVGGGTGASDGLARGIDFFIQNGGTLVFQIPSSTTLTLFNSIDGDGMNNGGGVTIASSQVNFSASNTYTGTTKINALATLNIPAAASLGSSGNTLAISGTLQAGGNLTTPPIAQPIVITTDGTFDTNGFSMGLDGVISGTGALTKLGVGTLFLTGGNTFTGNVVIEEGTLNIIDDNNLGNSANAVDLGSALGPATLQAGDSGISSTRSLVLESNDVTIDSNNSDITWGGVISGAFPLTFESSSGSAGVITLTAANTYSGETTIASGTLALSGSTGTISDSSGVTFSGSTGVFDISQFAGNPTIGSLSGAATGTIVALGGNTLLIGGSNLSTSYAGTIQDGGIGGGSGASLEKIGTGTLTLTNSSNSYSGGTIIDGGILNVTSDGALGNVTGPISIDGATLQAGGTITSSRTITLEGGAGGTLDTNGFSMTFSSAIGQTGGASALTKQGAGTLTLQGVNTYTGGTIVDAGTLALSMGGSLVSSGSVTVNNTSIFDISGITASSQTIKDLSGASTSFVNLGSKNLTTGNGSSASPTYAGTIEGSGGSLTFEGTGTFTLTGTNTYTGGTTVTNTGTLALSGSGTLSPGTTANTGAVVLNGGNFSIAASSIDQTIGSLSGNSTSSTLTLGASGVTLTVNETVAGTFPGVITGSGDFVKQGTETLTLTNAGNNYSGGTTINAGSLALSGTGALLNTGSVTINNSGTFDISNAASSRTIGDLISASSTADVNLGANTLTVGNGPSTHIVTYAGVIGGTGGLTYAGNSPGVLTLTGTNTYTGTTTISGTGTLALSGSGVLDSPNLQATVAITNGVFDLSQVTTAPTIGDLSGNTGTFVRLGSRTLTLGTANSTTYSGALQDGGLMSGTGAGLTKVGTGTLTLAGDNNYSGPTTLSGGTLALSGSGTVDDSSGVVFNMDNVIFDISQISGSGTTIQDLSSVDTSDIVALGSKQLSLGTNHTTTFNGVIQDTGISMTTGGSILKQGTGTLILTNANTYTGGTTIDEGTIELQGAGSLPPPAATNEGALTLNGGNFDISLSSNDQTIGTLSGTSDSSKIILGDNALIVDQLMAGTFAGSIEQVMGSVGDLIKEGSATLTLEGANTYTGGTTISTGTLALSMGGSLAPTGNVTVNGTSTFDISQIAPASSVTIGDLEGTSGSFVALGSKKLIVGNGSSDNMEYDGTIQDTALSGGVGGSLTFEGTGTFTLTGTNTYTGGTTIDSGTLALSGSGTLASTGDVTINDSGIFDISAASSQTIQDLISSSSTAAVNLGANTLTVGNSSANNVTFAGIIGDMGLGGSLVFEGTGIFTLSGMNTYTGGTTIDSGSIALTGTGTLGDTGPLALNGGNFDIHSGMSQTIGVLSGTSSSSKIILGSNSLTVDEGGAMTTFPGVISGTGGVALNTTMPSDSLTLTGANTYTGGTTVNGPGTLFLSMTGSLAPTGNVTVNNTSTFDISGITPATSVTIGNLVGSNTSFVNLGSETLIVGNGSTNNFTYPGTIEGSGGSLTYEGTGIFTLSGINTYDNGTTINSGTIALGSTGTLGDTGPLTLDGGSFDISGSSTGQIIGVLSGDSVDSKIILGLNSLTVDQGNSATTTFAGVISGMGDFTLNATSPASLTFTGPNTYSGDTTINGGTLLLLMDGTLGQTTSVDIINSGILDISGIEDASLTIMDLNGVSGTFIDLGSKDLIVGNGSSDDLSYAGVIEDGGGSGGIGGSLTFEGTGTFTLSGANTYTGGTTIDSGTLALSGSGTLATTGNVTINDSGTFDISAAASQTIRDLISSSSTAVVNLGVNTLTVGNGSTDNTTFAGAIGDMGLGGSLAYEGNSPGSFTLTGTNTYTGTTTISGTGTLALKGAGVLDSPDQLALIDITSSGVFDVSQVTAAPMIGDLNGTGFVRLGSNTLTLGGTNDNSAYSGAIQDGGIGGGSHAGLTKAGTGTLTLQGVNTYSGTTTIEGGTLALAGAGVLDSPNFQGAVFFPNDSGTFDISGTSGITIGDLSTSSSSPSNSVFVNLGTETLTLGTSNNTTFAGVIEGSGNLVKQRSGTLTLTNANTYIGGTTINVGTIAVSGIGTLGDTGPLALNGGNFDITASGIDQAIGTLSGTSTNSKIFLGSNMLTINEGSSQNFPGVISGTGAIVLQGGNTLTLTNVNTYTGGTTIQSASTLSLSPTGQLFPTGPVTINDTSTFNINSNQTIGNLTGSSGSHVTLGSNVLTVNEAGMTTFAGVISGGPGGALIKSGSGTLTLSGGNTYPGGTTINAGTLALATPGFLAASAPVTINNAGSTFDISQTAGEIIGDLTGGAGTIVSLGGAGTVLTLGTSHSTTFSGVMQDGGLGGGIGGGLTKQGSGKFSIVGNQTYTGPTTVNAGNLNVNGSLTSSVTVNSGAILTGIASIDSLTVNVGGTVRPGNSIGTITVNGNFDLFGTYDVELNAAGQNDLIQVVAGSSTIEPSGMLHIIADPGTYTPPIFYTIISADTANGTFAPANITQNTASLLFTVHYYPTAVVLELYGTTPFPPFVPPNFPGNAGAVAKCFVTMPLVPFSDVETVTLALENLDFADQVTAFNHMSPAQFSALTLVQENNMILVRSSYTRHLRDIHNIQCRTNPKHGYNIWMDGVGQWQDAGRTNQQFGFDTDTAGMTMGIDYHLNDLFSLGAAGSYTTSYVKWDSAAGSAHIKSYYGGIYGSLSREFYYLDFAVIGASNHYKVDRHIPISTLNRHARHSNSGFEFLTSADYGYKFTGPKYIVTPFLRVDYVFLHQNSYREDGAISLNLESKGKTTQWMQGEVGLRGSRCVNLPSGGQFIPELQIGYINQTALTSGHYRAKFTDESCPPCCVINVRGIKQERNLLDLNAAATIQSASQLVDVTGRYDVQLGSHYTVQEASLNINFKF